MASFHERETTSESSSLKQMILGFDSEVPIVDISPDNEGTVYKVIMSSGVGDEMPQQGDHVYIKYTQKEISETRFSSDFVDGQKFEFTLGDDDAMPVLDMGVATMQKGEKARFFCHPSHALGRGQIFDNPADYYAIFEIELMTWETLPPVANAENLEEKYESKIRVYKSIINNLQSELELDDDQEEKENVIIAGFFEIAACYSQLGNYEELIENLKKILEYDDNNYDALFKIAQGYLALRNYDGAKEYYCKIKEKFPNDEEAEEKLFAINEVMLYKEHVERNSEDRLNAFKALCQNIAKEKKSLQEMMSAIALTTIIFPKGELAKIGEKKKMLSESQSINC